MKHLFVILTKLFVFLTLSGLGGMSLQAQQPYAMGSFPNNGAVNIFCHPFIRVHIHFPGEGKRLNRLSLTPENVRLYPADSPEEVLQAQLDYEASFRYIHLRPLELLRPQTEYIFEITSGLKDERDNAFQPYKLNFTTGNCQQGAGLLAARGQEEPPPPEPEIPQPRVQLAAIEATLQGQAASIQWSTQQEFMQDNFRIAKAGPERIFHAMDSIPSKGDSEELQRYRVVDSAPAYGINYYCITAMDILGNPSFSDTLAIFREFLSVRSDTLGVDEALILDILVAPRTSMALVLLDETEQEVFRKATFLPHGQRSFPIPLSGVPPGRYRVVAVTPQSRIKSTLYIQE